MTNAPFRLLFVCSGNICRSPMGEGLARHWAAEHGVSIEVKSAGTLELVDRAAAPKAVAVCREIGIDIADHRSQPLTADLIAWADCVAVMETAHSVRVFELCPQTPTETVVLMGPLVGKPEIADPIGAWTKGPFRTARDEIRVGIRRILEPLLS